MTDRPLRFDGLPMANHQTPGAFFGFGGRMRMVEKIRMEEIYQGEESGW
jgi:hypothetical protein